MALIPPFFFDCVVAIGEQDSKGNKSWIGTGFLFGKFVQQNPDGTKGYRVYLVTNKHVLDGFENIILRFNPQSGTTAKDYPISLSGDNNQPLWIGHPIPEVDVAVLGINAQKLQDEGMKFNFFESDESVFTMEKMKEAEITEGDYIYVLGFPMGLMDVDRQYVILRSGAIARVRDLFEGRSTSFIVDALVFPGNSGGPVVLKPEAVSIDGTKSNMSSSLIGLVKSYIPYQDVAVSQQTGKPRIIFEDNSGLSLVEPVDYILEAIEYSEQLQPQPPTKIE